jgi:hypothetical protein
MERTKSRKARPGSAPWLQQSLQVAGTFLLITVLWSMWNAPSMRAWFDVITWWRIG